MRALIVTNLYPSQRRPALGSFVRNQVEALSRIDGSTPYAERMRLLLRLRRLGYRCAYTLLRVYSLVRRPQLRGVKCVLLDGEDVLLVRHTYGPRAWDLPGGAIKRGEEPITAAQREIHEELGFSIDDWHSIGAVMVTVDRRTDFVHCFQAHAPGRAVTLDEGEIAEADWFPRGRLPTNLSRYARPILMRAAGPPGTS